MCDSLLGWEWRFAMGKRAVGIALTEIERRELESLASRRKTAQGLAQRARIVLLAAEGAENKDISLRMGAAPNTVGKWRRRFAEHRLGGLYDEPRPGAPRQIGDEEVAEIVRLTLEATPRDATHWSLRSLARAVGLAPSTIHRIWKAFSLQPHRAETFKLSTDPLFVEKVRDIVGLYLSPPDRAIVLCVDEKSQIQALDRTQPLLPMRPGQIERRTHDYARHGTLSLFAALDAATGAVIGKCFARHRAREFRAFLNVIEANVPDALDVHVIMDNVSTHKTQAIRNWFAKRPRWHTHYTPTSASWISLVERFFANLTDKQIRRGAHRSTAELEAAIASYIDAVNANPKPFVWTKSANDILASVKRFCAATLAAAQTQTKSP
jgi:transposase-like protein